MASPMDYAAAPRVTPRAEARLRHLAARLALSSMAWHKLVFSSLVQSARRATISLAIM